MSPVTVLKNLVLSSAIATLVLLPTSIFALASPADPMGLGEGLDLVERVRGAGGVRGFTSIGEFITLALAVVVSFLGIVALGMLIYGAFVYVTSAGDENKASHGKKVILYAIIGILIL